MSFSFDHDYHPWAQDDTFTADWGNQGQEGIQNWVEALLGAYTLNGIETGLTPTLDTANDEVDIASGTCFVAGKRVTGSGSEAFTTEATNTYYIYLDASDETDPLKKSTSNPGNTGNYLTLCSCLWTLATTTLSDLVDLRPFGVTPWSWSDGCNGVLPTASTSDPVGVLYLPRDVWIETVGITLYTQGATSGNTIVDVHQGVGGAADTTIFTTQARCPTIAYTVTCPNVAVSGVPDGTRSIDAGQYLSWFLNEKPGAGSPADLGVTVYGRYRL